MTTTNQRKVSFGLTRMEFSKKLQNAEPLTHLWHQESPEDYILCEKGHLYCPTCFPHGCPDCANSSK